ncbi:hypothetical protein CLV47_13211 [Antricoccus suffuscus]|uniref:HipA-like kinase domain-containing protein n=1 Tax=Antricoccus suffuscus TaxID=1629062 RepID=A0A2T0Z024_9ACTN|nr:HipA family kinase [Antricoccus suffuscus]PRZ29702.1 hypothetical protein CLV47_13211 [Antricoccus suffuscus]
MLEHIIATRYVLPLREGGSLPGLMEADDLGTYIVKFSGAGQGKRVLVAEIIAAAVARSIGLRTPDLKLIELPAPIAKYEADEEAQDLLTASIGLNLASDFLPGSFAFDDGGKISADESAKILWLDLLIGNPDRTWRNPNLLMWHRDLWCIDHGAAFYPHHGWGEAVDPAKFDRPLMDIATHVMAPYADEMPAIHEQLVTLAATAPLSETLESIPDDWLTGIGRDPQDAREIYRAYLAARMADPTPWIAGLRR